MSVHLSNGDGTYRDGNQEVFGELVPSLGGASRKYDTGDQGNVDAVFAGFTGIGLQALRYSAEGWEDVKDEYPPEDTKNVGGITTARGTSTWAGEFQYQVLMDLKTALLCGSEKMMLGAKLISG